MQRGCEEDGRLEKYTNAAQLKRRPDVAKRSVNILTVFICRFTQPGCTAVQWEPPRTKKLLTAIRTGLTFCV